MKILRDVGVVLVAAVLTAAGTGLALRPATADAEDAPAVTNTVAGVEATVTLDKSKYEEGDHPVLTLVATNRKKEALACELEVRLLSQTVNPVARSLPIPLVAWSRTVAVKLEPGESKTITLKTDSEAAPEVHFSPLVLAAAPAASEGESKAGEVSKAEDAPKTGEVSKTDEKPHRQQVQQR